MLLTSIAFRLFLPVVRAPVGPRLHRRVLLVARYVFYAGGDWHFVPLLFLSTLVDRVAALRWGRDLHGKCSLPGDFRGASHLAQEARVRFTREVALLVPQAVAVSAPVPRPARERSRKERQ